MLSNFFTSERISDIKQLAKNTKRVLSAVWTLQRSAFIKALIVSVLIAGVPFVRSGALAILIDQLVVANSTYTQMVLVGLVLLVLASFLPQVLYVIQEYLYKHMWMRLQETFELMFNRKKGVLDVARHEDPKFNDTLNTAQERSVFPILQMAEAQFANMQNVIQVIIAASILFAFEWYFLAIIIAGTLPEFFIRMRYGKNVWGIFHASATDRRRFISVRNHFFGKSDILELKAFRNVEHFIGLMREMLIDFNNKQLSEEKNKAWFSVLGSVVSIGAFATVLTIVVGKVLDGSMTVGTMTFLISSIGGFSSAISGFLLSIANQSEMSHFATDIFKVLDAEEIITDPEHPKELNLTKPPEITFENVSFCYPGTDTFVLRDVSFTIKPGERVALIGVNGAGKTTLTKLLARYYDPTSGRILINNIDLRELSRDEWYTYLTILSQDYATYESFRTADMIALGNTEHATNIDHVKKAASMSEATSFIESWEKGYDQVIGKQFDNGIDPSKGQNQRLALARALYRNPKILVLDEPTSSVDADAESKIFTSLENLPRDHTLILISHRFSTVRSADTIHVIKDGDITESGSHEDLISQDGIYAELFRKQAHGYR